MAPQPNPRPAAGSRRPARDLIDAVLENMRANLEPLKYSTLAPSRYIVYLHPEEYARIEGIVPVLQEQTARALAEALQKLNNRPAYRKYFDRLVPAPRRRSRTPARDWQIEFHPDADGELAPGDILIHSELMLPPGADDLGAGQRTRRITTVHAGSERRSARKRCSPTVAAASAFTRGCGTTTTGGPHTFDIARDSIVIGRGGIAYRADVRIDASVDVSREHARIRRDPAAAAFFIIDLEHARNDGERPAAAEGLRRCGRDQARERRRDAAAGGSRIGLADTVFLQFDIIGRS